MVANPSAMRKLMHTKQSFTILMSVIIFGQNGSYGIAALKLKKFGLAGSTIATIASTFTISEERRNLQGNCPITSYRKIIVPRDTADYFVKN